MLTDAKEQKMSKSSSRHGQCLLAQIQYGWMFRVAIKIEIEIPTALMSIIADNQC